MSKEVFTTHDVAQSLSVDISTVIHWIDQTKLPAYRTPGGHRRIKRKDLLSFLVTYNLPVPETLEKRAPVILIVEDDGDFRLTLRSFIEELRPDVVVHEASDGFLAGKRVEEFKPDVVILDLFLPGVNGFQVCEYIRRDPELADTRIVAISGKNTLENQARISQAGADAFLAKPFGLVQFREVLDKLLSEPKPERPKSVRGPAANGDGRGHRPRGRSGDKSVPGDL